MRGEIEHGVEAVVRMGVYGVVKEGRLLRRMVKSWGLRL